MDPAVPQDDIASRVDQPGGVEMAVRPLRVGLELVAADVDAELSRLGLERRGDLTGHRVAGLADPFVHALAAGWSLERELRQQDEPGRRLRGHAAVDEHEPALDVAADDRP